jgi:hypothetical protein
VKEDSLGNIDQATHDNKDMVSFSLLICLKIVKKIFPRKRMQEIGNSLAK